MKCFVCEKADFSSSFTVTRRDPYRELVDEHAPLAVYHVCKSCEGMIFEGDSRAEHVYDTGTYYGVDGDAQTFLERRFTQVASLPPERSDNQARVSRIREFVSKHFVASRVPDTLRVADVGAGMGIFLHQFLDERWHGTAIEPDPHACDFMRKKMPRVEVLQGYSGSVPHRDAYHLITLNRVLEHVTNPRALLISESTRLHRDGLIYLEVPDVDSFFRDGPNNEAFGYTHFVVFSPLTLLIAVRETPLEVLHLNRVIEPSGKFTLYAFLKKRNYL